MSLGSAGFLAAATVSAIVGARAAGRRAWAGLPSAVYQAGAALAAFVWGGAMDRLGRRPTLVAGDGGRDGRGRARQRGGGAADRCRCFLLGAAAHGHGQRRPPARTRSWRPRSTRRPSAAGAIARVVMGGTVGAVLGPAAGGAGQRRARRAAGPRRPLGPYAASAALFAWRRRCCSRCACGRSRGSWRGEMAARHPRPRPKRRRRGPGRRSCATPRCASAVLTLVCGQVGDDDAHGHHLAAHDPPPSRALAASSLVISLARGRHVRVLASSPVASPTAGAGRR